MEVTTGEHCCRAVRIKEKCPSCSAPIVGTNPRIRSSARAWRPTCFIQATVWITSIVRWRAGPCASSGGLGTAFTIEVNQISRERFCAQLAQQGGYLSAMIGAMVHEVLKHLPKRS